ncbi:MAG: Leukotoxin [Planctomycetota bacterium]|jgi:hypothetical protein
MRQADELPHIPWLGELKTFALGDAERERLIRALAADDLVHEAESRTYWSAILGLSIAAISLLASHVSTHGGFLSEPARSAGIGPRSSVESGVPEMRGMRSMMAGVLGAVAVATSSDAQNAVQWRVEDGGNGHWYRIIYPSTGFAAQAQAQALGGHLVTITSATENGFVHSLHAQGGREWTYIGFVQADDQPTPSSGWSWLNGEAATYSNWSDHSGVFPTGAPDDTPCALPPWGVENNQANQGVMQFDGRWDDIDRGAPTCGSPTWNNAAIVEWSADCNNDGVVDYGQILAGHLPDVNADNVPDCCAEGRPCPMLPMQWTASQGGNDHWYQVHFHTTGIAAESEARAIGAYLATIANSAENAYVHARYLQSGRQWAYIGLVQLDNQQTPAAGWRWINGEAMKFTNWTSHNGAFPTGAPDDTPCALPPWGIENNQANQGVMQFDGRWDDIERGAPTCGSPVWNNSSVFEWSADCNSDGIVDFGQIRDGSLEDLDRNGVPDCCEHAPRCDCPSDIDRNSSVDGIDLAIILSKWGTNGGKDYPSADIDQSGVVDGSDLAEVLNSWGACP